MTLLPILLPKGYTAKVAVGQKITAGKVIAEKTSESKDEIIHLAKKLGTSPKNVSKYLQKSLGSRIEEGDIIAISKKGLGFGKKEIVSEFSGTLIKIDEETGDIFVRILTSEVTGEQIISPVDGEVDFCDNGKIVLKTAKAAIAVIKANGNSCKGELLILEKKEVEDEDVKKEVDGKIVAAKNFEKAAIFKVFAIGGLGIISLIDEEEDFEDIFQKNLTKPLCLITKEGFEELEKYKGKEIYLDLENKTIIAL